MSLSLKWLVAPLAACALLLTTNANEAQAQFGHIGGGHGFTQLHRPHIVHRQHIVRRPLHRYVSPVHTMGRTALHRSYNTGYPAVNHGYVGIPHSGFRGYSHGYVAPQLNYHPPQVIHHGNRHAVIPARIDVHNGLHH